MNPQWEYTNTKISREFTKQNYSRHLNDMGSQGWELVTVDTYADQGFNLLYWKRPFGAKSGLEVESNSVEESEKIDNDLKMKKDTSIDERVQTPPPVGTSKAIKPIFASIVRYVIQDGFMDKMLGEICDGPSPEAQAQYTLQISASEIVNVTMVPELDDMIKKEETGVNWLKN